jgi:hypothetical protein
MKVTAVVLQYYPERIQNIPRIISDLKNSSRPPNKIIVFNNNPEVKIEDYIKDEDVVCVRTTHDFGTRSKYEGALLDFADYYLLIDDDITVSKKTIEHLISVIPDSDKPFCTAQQGMIMNGKLLHDRITITDSEIKKPTATETLIGSFIFCSFSAIVKMLSYEQECRKMIKSHGLMDILGDDLLMGFANAPIVIYPAKEDEKIIDLPDGGQCANLYFPQGVMTAQRDKIAPLIKDFIDKKNGR